MSKHERSRIRGDARGRLPVGFQVLAVVGVLLGVLIAAIVVVVMSLVPSPLSEGARRSRHR